MSSWEPYSENILVTEKEVDREMEQIGKLRKLMLLAAMLAIIAVVASPAAARVSQVFSISNITSGSATPSVVIKNSGNNVNMCEVVLQPTNTGNVANQQGVVQYNSTAGSISFGGSSINVGGSVAKTCTQTIRP